MPAIKFYFDFMSPYSCLAWQWLSQQKFGQDNAIYFPISMGSLIASFDTKGPAQIPVKRDYLFKAALRAAAKNDFYLEIPKKLPFNSVLVQRLGQKGVAQEQQRIVIDCLFKGIWRDGIEMEDPEILKKYLAKSLDEEFVEQIFERSSSKEARIEQRHNQSQVINDGAFGVPSFVVNEELFWGFDARNDLVSFLNNTDLLDQEKFKNFLQLFSPA